ncbi:hypothetical protein LF599_16900 [Pseudodesulfovibrio thermohalotolerans]|uniref:hypothetical protein n=1 Tax=Pseudodesulfovibrio thermohalotolerans TaxID=2880651 RepID=UPI0022B9DDD2|nr:hypothetical protein [Pseudodesulfovibrio thermohalotolerans]WFS62317.1 hypothetical protein LF599_16900 [Pseudodesulfovibrio thermohalotolerans]
MVCKIESLNHDDVALVEGHVGDRRRGRNRDLFLEFEDEWKHAVQNYIEHQGNPEHIVPIGIEEGRLKTALHNLWDHPTGRSREIKDELQSHNLNYCPFCGEMGHPETHDHYLPKAHFAEFSIAHCNLVPMCDACQGRKRTEYLINGHKGFLHPYYDEGIIINLSITGDFDPVPMIELEYACPADLQLVLETHLDSLDVKERIFKHLSNFYMGIVMGLTAACANKEDVRQAIIDSLTINKTTYETISINHWDAIIYRSLLSSDEWIDHMVQKCEAARAQ